MWSIVKWGALCICVMISLPRVSGSLAEEMAETTAICCNQGTSYGRNHTVEDCSSSVPPDVPAVFGSLCIFAMDQCCKEYFQKKKDCESGIDLATSTNQCVNIKDSVKSCCTECTKGTLSGTAKGIGVCSPKIRGNSAEELLAGDAFTQCCQKAANEGRNDQDRESESHRENHPAQTKPSGSAAIASLCEEYAPNELCAHHCIPVPGSYKCECNPGFKLMADGRNCMEVVKNRCKPRNPCQHKCNDNGVEVKCSCRRGYKLKKDGKSCEDINECSIGPPICLPGSQCYNIQGSYKCIPLKKQTDSSEKGKCPPGFSRNVNNNVCDDINECEMAHPPCPSYLCENTVGGYKCGGMTGDPANLNNDNQPADDRCPTGFRMGLNEECEDVDECDHHKDDCNPLSQFCINTRGSYYCQNKVSKHCPPGFKINSATNKCEDINECEDGEDICRPDQMCVNVPGEYDCKPKDDHSRSSRLQKCPDGMRVKQGKSHCEDIDECTEGTHLCDQHQRCLNTNGSHECHCKLGFEQDPTTGACVDVNECATDQHNCISGSQRCDNTVGSFLCIRFTSCGTGYILHHSSSQCEDIDECALGTHNCARAGPEFHCENHPGSFRCVRKHQTTSSTTAAPEYEYEYYDSEEETDANLTKPDSKQPETKPTIPTTTLTPTDAPTPSTRPTYDIPSPSPIPEIVSRINNVESNEKTEPEYTEPSLKYEPNSNETNTNKAYETIPAESNAYEQSANEHEDQTPKVEPDQSTNELAPPEPEPETTKPQIEPESHPAEPSGPTLDSSPVPPQLVYVDVGKETATVEGVKTDDGAVVVDTQNVPKNEWTKVQGRPTNCQPGFEMDDLGACVDIDECSKSRHSCSSLTETCRNTMGGYLCDCAPGFRRDITGACDVITTSSSTSTTTQAPVSSSTTERGRNFFWGYPDYRPMTSRPFRPRTMCDVGYHLNSQTGKCEDIDECTNGQANCAAVEICVNTEGGYRCECPPNWRLDEVRHRCVPLKSNGQFPTGYGNEPVYRPENTEDNLQHQVYRGSKYVEPEIKQLEDRGSVITCPTGYKLGFDNTCEDIDECSSGQAICGVMQCTNLPGGYVCSCPQGHKLVDGNACEDVDECALEGSTPICSQHADCVNTVGSYQCKCHSGFRSAVVNDKVCIDVDECMESPTGSLCQQRCNNVWGGYRCSCHRGYRLNSDNSTCSDVDECTEFKHKIPCVGRCVNEPGSYRCMCPGGYRLSEDKRSCIDIDECETGEAPCAKGSDYGSTSDVCLNTRGGYRCQRIACPPGYKLESRHRCTRIEKVCPPLDWECAHQPTTYSYNFITFVSKLYVPESNVALFTMRGPAWPNAKMRFELRLVDVNAPPSVKEKADINTFLLSQSGNQAVMSLVKSLEGPQSIELELSMELYNGDQFGGIAVAKIYIYVSEYEF